MSLVIGIDPSLTGTGIAIINDGEVTVHTVTSKGTAGDTLAQRRMRSSSTTSFPWTRAAQTRSTTSAPRTGDATGQRATGHTPPSSGAAGA